jgi:predicted Zn-dependent peptidase
LLVGTIGCRGDQAGAAVLETLSIMESLRRQVPARELELKRLDALNSFVFNLDTKTDLVQAYSRYYMRQEPLDTLQRIQEAFFSAKREELREIARSLLAGDRIQVHVVADKTTPVSKPGGTVVTLGEELQAMARSLNLPFREIEWR